MPSDDEEDSNSFEGELSDSEASQISPISNWIQPDMTGVVEGEEDSDDRIIREMEEKLGRAHKEGFTDEDYEGMASRSSEALTSLALLRDSSDSGDESMEDLADYDDQDDLANADSELSADVEPDHQRDGADTTLLPAPEGSEAATRYIPPQLRMAMKSSVTVQFSGVTCWS